MYIVANTPEAVATEDLAELETKLVELEASKVKLEVLL